MDDKFLIHVEIAGKELWYQDQPERGAGSP